MKDGFVKVAAASVKIKVADPEFNTEACIKTIKKAEEMGVKLLVFPELVLTGYTCNDLFLQERLLDKALYGLEKIINVCMNDMIVVVGMPLELAGKLYNVAVFIQKGKILAIVPKLNLPNYAEFYEVRYFTPGQEEVIDIELLGQKVPFGMNILINVANIKGFVIAAELCEDLWVLDPPSTSHVKAGASVIVNLSASDENVGKSDYRRNLVQMTSARLVGAYIYASATEGESTQDIVFSGHNVIAENGIVLNEAERFSEGIVTADIDLSRLSMERRRMTTFKTEYAVNHKVVDTALEIVETKLERYVDPAPFVPGDIKARNKRCEEILSIQSYGLKKRLEHTSCKNVVIGISGGLDSTLALIVTAKAFELAGLDKKGILAVTMPCFGTTSRTKNNADELSLALGTTPMEINIEKAVLQHFEDIGQDINNHDVTYENGQARERTQVLMNLANKTSALVIGTGDMSELALGWATYNGDHMSMYGVNAGVPKTLVKYLVAYYADVCGDEKLSMVLKDILDTPVSPELLPPTDGEISQKTEDLVGPYELHDFYLYNMLRCGFSPDKVLRLAKVAFADKYEEEIIVKWLKTFYRRFFSQQFKRSCLPDGPKVGSVAVSPRGDLRMPSDASMSAWLI